MRLRGITILLLCSISITDVLAQLPPVRRNTNIAVGINHRMSDSTLVSNLNIGLLSNTDSLRGFQLGLLTSVVRRDMQGREFGRTFYAHRTNCARLANQRSDEFRGR